MIYKQLVLPSEYFRDNKILNGEFLIAQRGKTFNFDPSLPAGNYSFQHLDKFIIGAHISNNLGLGIGERIPKIKLTQEAFTQGSSGNPPGNPEKYLRLYFIDAGAAPSPYSFIIINHILDEPKSLLGQTATLSFYARTSTLNRKIGVRVHSTDSLSDNHKIFFKKTVTTDGSRKWNRFVETFKIPNFLQDYNLINTIYFQLMFQCGSSVGNIWNTNTTPVIAGETIDIADLKLEIGDLPTPMPREPYLQQLLKCQQYYWEVPDGAILPGYSSSADSGGYVISVVNFPVRMRRIPTISISSQIFTHIPGIDIGNKNLNAFFATTELCEFSVLTSYPSARPAILQINKNSGQYLKADAS